MTDTLLTVEEIADRLRIHEETVRRWLRAGQLKGIRLGSKSGYRVAQADFDEFMRQRGTWRSDTVRTDLERRILDAIADHGVLESVLAMDLGVDTATVRAAWMRLQQQGLVSTAVLLGAATTGGMPLVQITEAGLKEQGLRKERE